MRCKNNDFSLQQRTYDTPVFLNFGTISRRIVGHRGSLFAYGVSMSMSVPVRPPKHKANKKPTSDLRQPPPTSAPTSTSASTRPAAARPWRVETRWRVQEVDCALLTSYCAVAWRYNRQAGSPSVCRPLAREPSQRDCTQDDSTTPQ